VDGPWEAIGGICIDNNLFDERQSTMIIKGILNPKILSLIARVRHTNTLVIADRGFPYWPTIETVDISLVDDIPTVLEVFEALKANFVIGQIYMAEEFIANNSLELQQTYANSRGEIPITYVPHIELKLRVPQAIGLIRTGDSIQFSNMILVSA
jgi:D-ribose pyranase